MKTVVLGVTGSVAAHKVIDLISLLKEEDWSVYVIMTDAATQMVSIDIVKQATGNPVFTDLFPRDFNRNDVLEKREVDHIAVAKRADVFVVAPATANTIAKIATGVADNFLTASLLATQAPVIVAPAMNTVMWQHPATQKNISLLYSYGYRIVEPTVGMLACGYEGKGKLENVTEIAKAIERAYTDSQLLHGKKIIVTAGATREYIDNVRFITNPSTGKMGVALAEAAFLKGADVLLLRADSSTVPRYAIQEQQFSSSHELSYLLQKYSKKYEYLFHTAAVGDFSVKNPTTGKLSSKKNITLTLSPKEKIIEKIKQHNPKIHLIGFKAEYQLPKNALVKKAYEKLQASAADMIIANDVGKKGSGFGSDNNDIFVVFPNGDFHHIPLSPKKIIAEEILSLVFGKK